MGQRVDTDVSVVVCGFIVVGPFVLAALGLGCWATWLAGAWVVAKIAALETLLAQVGTVGALVFLVLWVVAFFIWAGAEKARTPVDIDGWIRNSY